MVDTVKYGANPNGVRVQPLVYEGSDGQDRVMTQHGYAIVVNNKLIGRVKNVTEQAFTRTITPLYELSHQTFGHPVELVPSKIDNQQLMLERAEVWDKELEVAFGFGATFQTLLDQRSPFTIQAYLYKGSDIYSITEYRGCWFQEKNIQQYSAEGDATIITAATVPYTRRTIIGGTASSRTLKSVAQ